jgi:hypothetical protein
VKIGRNELCPCGTGKKFKKCCGALETYTRDDRADALRRLDHWIELFAGAARDEAHEEFWGPHVEYIDSLPEDLEVLSDAAEDAWFAFDRDGETGKTAVDRFIADADLSEGELTFLSACRRSSVRLYTVVGVVPGVSLTLRDAIEGGEITVHERMGSRSIGLYEHVAARVVPRGPSGGPEIESGILHVPALYKDSVISQVRAHRARFLDEHRGMSIDTFYKTMGPFFHEVWAGSFLDAAVPEMRMKDGELVVPTTVRFSLVDAVAFERALEARSDLEREGETWISGELGRIERRNDHVIVETQTVERGRRARALLEEWVGDAIRHRATVHENLQREVKDRIRARFLGGDSDAADDEPSVLPPEVTEPLVLGHYGAHYRRWIDEPVPALDGATPREGAHDPKLRGRAIDLIEGLVAMYQRALRDNQPAYDPSWMWAELGLVDPELPRHPPPLAYERVASAIEGSGELVRVIAERTRRDPSFGATSSVAEPDVASDLEVQRFVRGPGARALPYLPLMIEFEVHRRKTFWVDEALAYTLDQTELDVVGRELRVPFPTFALVFTDRHVLSLAERLLARRENEELAGQLLRVVTIHVAERRAGDARSLAICIASDALGADLPSLVRHEILLGDDVPVQRYVDQIAPLPDIDPPPPDMNPIRGLLRTAINAILYATSASVEPQTRSPPSPPSRSTTKPHTFSSDEVYFLPGTIDITRVRKLQELERAPGGRALLRRYMVRGHWRRAAKTWSDQRLRWIEPHWKGPDMAAVIEQAYRLKP